MKSLVTSLPLGEVVGLRGLFALAVVLLLAPRVGGMARLRANNKRHVLLCSGLLVCNILLFPLCLPYLPFADAIILAYTSPIWVVAFAPLLLSEKTRWQQWAAVFIGFAGACLVIKPGENGVSWIVVVPLVVACIVGLRDIVTRKIAASESAISIVAYANLLTIIVGVILIPVGWNTPSPTQVLQLVMSGICFSVAQLIMVEAFRLAEATVLSTFKYSSILFATMFGYLFWGEIPDMFAGIGALLIIISGLMVVRYRRQPAPTLANVLPRNARNI